VPRRRIVVLVALVSVLVEFPVQSVARPPSGERPSLGARLAEQPSVAARLAERLADDTARFPQGWQGYHTYAEMVAAAAALEARHPGLVRVRSIGRSHEGRRILAIRISDRVAIDEGEPEILLDGLHHGREHLSAEQMLATARFLVRRYGEDPQVTRLVDRRVWWIVPMVNPDGGEHDIRGGSFRRWRKNRQPNGADRPIGTDLNRNYGYRWGCCGGSSGSPGADDYRGARPFSAPEARVLRDFVRSREIDGRQRIRVHLSFHSAGAQVLWPYAYTRRDRPPSMSLDDHRTFKALARGMAERNGYTAMQSSDLYPTDGDLIDWMYARHGTFSFTVEMWPARGGSMRWYPDDSRIGPQTARNQPAILYLAQRAWCPWAVIGREAARC
jgi:murein tripeptide amidase MpaA